jgi:ubiquinone biosynthesis protein
VAVLLLPFQIAFVVVGVLVLGLMAQRLLGLRLGTARMILTGIFAAVMYPILTLAIINAASGANFDTTQDRPELFWFALLSAMLTVLAAMAFIVIVEAFVPLGAIPPATVWGRGIQGRINRTRRYWQIIGIAYRKGLVSYIRGGRSKAFTVSSGRVNFGRTLTSTMNAAGVTFVKLGQSLATRRDLLPAEVALELSSLQDQAEPVPWDDLRAVLDAELPAPVEELFAEFDTQPLAAASVGQVHLARLHDGTEVVVKVQRPGIGPIVERDLDIAERLASRLDATTTWGRNIGIKALAAGLGAALREELDYRVEADNIMAIARSTSRDPDVLLPTPHLPLCTERVLVMERLAGTPIAKAAADLDPETRERLAKTLLDSLLRQIVLDGVFHADPHAGNILVTDDGGLALLDFGSVGRLDGNLRAALQRLFLAVDRSDPLAVSDALLELVPRPDEIDQQRLERDLGRFMAKYAEGGATSAGVRMFGDLFKVVADHGLAIPPEIAAVFRSLATVEGTLTLLAPSFDLVVETKRLATEYLSEQLEPDRLQQIARDELAALVPILKRLPRRIDRIASAAENGRLSANIRLFADERDRAVVRDMVHEILLAFLAAATGLMAVILIGIDNGPTMTGSVGLYAFLGYNLLAVSAILGLRVLAQIFRRSS